VKRTEPQSPVKSRHVTKNERRTSLLVSRFVLELVRIPFFAIVTSLHNQFLDQLMKGNESVLALMGPLPEELREPPRMIRVLLFDYTFSTPQELKETGKWWNRIPKGRYIPFALVKNGTSSISEDPPDEEDE